MVNDARRRLAQDGPVWTRGPDRDFETVTVPEHDCDLLRDLLISEGVERIVEIGLAYASSALAIGEALAAAANPRHIIIDPFQTTGWSNVGWDLLRSAGLEPTTTLIEEWSSIVLPRLVTEGFVADAAFVDGSHRFHEVFLDFYYLRKIVKPGGLIVIDDHWVPSIRAAAHYYELNLGWTAIPDAFAGGTMDPIGREPHADMVSRCRAYRLPDAVLEPPFLDFHPF